MAKTPSRAADLEKMIRQLRADRQAHVDAIAQIDATFARFGITADDRAGSRRGRKPGRPKAAKAVKKRRKRGSFSKTADQFLLDLLKGGKKLTTKEINQRWKQAKRGGTADTPLGRLVKSKKVKRENIEGKRGSSYSAA